MGGTIPAAQVCALNAWARRELDDWAARPCFDAVRKARGGAGLIDYGVPRGGGGRSVVYADFLARDASGAHVPHVDAEAAQWLRHGGVRRVVTGHMPWGSEPTVIVAASAECRGRDVADGSVRVIACDTSYSGASVTDRGCAVAACTVRIDDDGADSTRLEGVRADGTRFDFVAELDAHIGRPTAGGWFVKTRLGTGEYILCRSRPGAELSSQVEYKTTAEIF